MTQTFTVDDKVFAIVPLCELERLRNATEAVLPPLPPVDADGTMDAIAAAKATIARTIIRRRMAAGLKAAELAKRAGISAETLSRIETGKHKPQTATLEKIEQVLT